MRRIAWVVALAAAVVLSGCSTSEFGVDWEAQCQDVLAGIDLVQKTTESGELILPGFQPGVDTEDACTDLGETYEAAGCSLEAAVAHIQFFAENKVDSVSPVAVEYFCDRYPASADELAAVSTTLPNTWTVGNCVIDGLAGFYPVSCDLPMVDGEILAIVGTPNGCATSFYIELSATSVACIETDEP